MNIERNYRLYDHTTDPECFHEFSDIMGIWKSKFIDGAFPSWSDFELEDFKGWYGQISLVEFDDQRNSHMILWGTKLVEWWGVDSTHKSLESQAPIDDSDLHNVENDYLKNFWIITSSAFGRAI